MSVKVRPLGVAMLAVLELVGGLSCFLLFSYLVFLISSPPSNQWKGTIGMVFFFLSMPLWPVIGIISFIMAYGYWKGKNWARMFGIVFSAIGAFLGLSALPSGIILLLTLLTYSTSSIFIMDAIYTLLIGIIPITICAVIIYYLMRPHVVQFFNTPKPSTPPYTPSNSTVAPPLATSLSASYPTAQYCKYCGNPLSSNARFCPKCGKELTS